MGGEVTPPSPAAQRRAEIADFVVALYEYYVRLDSEIATTVSDNGLPVPFEHMPPDLVAECHHAAKVLAQAVKLPGASCSVSRPQCY